MQFELSLQVCFERELDGMEAFALRAVNDETPAVAREAIRQLGETLPEKLIEFWENRELELRSELWLDLYTVMTSIDHAEAKQVAATYAAGDPGRVHALSLNGGDPSAGELVFRNQGACLQCHKIDGQGGVQGPELSLVEIDWMRRNFSSRWSTRALKYPGIRLVQRGSQFGDRFGRTTCF